LATAEVFGRLDHVVAQAEERRFHVVQAAELLPAVRQTAVCRRRNAELIEVARRHLEIVGDGQRHLGTGNSAAAAVAAVPRPAVADVDAEPWAQFVLDGDRALPVVILAVPSAEHAGRITRADQLAEAQVGPRTALAVSSGVTQIAIRYEIPIPGVVPRPGR